MELDLLHQVHKTSRMSDVDSQDLVFYYELQPTRRTSINHVDGYFDIFDGPPPPVLTNFEF